MLFPLPQSFSIYARGRIRLEKDEDVLTLPVTALVRHGNATTRCCDVRVGNIDLRQLKIEIVSRSTEHNSVITAGSTELTDGQPVQDPRAVEPD